jgi:hypothetical protein
MLFLLGAGKAFANRFLPLCAGIRRAHYCCAWILSLCLLGAPVGLRAQFSSVLEGTVTDASNAVIPEATVVVENPATNVSRTVQTSSSGNYRVASLPPGVFTLRVSKEGFQTLVQENITLEGTQVKTLNVQMQIGQATTTVNVVEAVPLVETGEATVSGYIQEREVADLPLVGRNLLRSWC